MNQKLMMFPLNSLNSMYSEDNNIIEAENIILHNSCYLVCNHGFTEFYYNSNLELVCIDCVYVYNPGHNNIDLYVAAVNMCEGGS